MPVRYLLDTNIASYLIKGMPQVSQRLQQVPIWDVGISVITEAELRFGGVRRPQAAQLMLAIETFLRHVEIVPWNSQATEHYSWMRKALEDSGTPMGTFDMLIAAQALALDAVLVTHDRVFQRVSHLKVEDWTKR